MEFITGPMLTIYYRTLYRPVMRLAHKFGWHHMKTSRPYPDRGVLHWCHWCGVRCVIPDPINPIQ